MRSDRWGVIVWRGRGVRSLVFGRFFAAEDFPPAAEHRSFGVFSSFSAATRLGALGQRIDDALYAADLALTPLARQHAVHLHVYRAPA